MVLAINSDKSKARTCGKRVYFALVHNCFLDDNQRFGDKKMLNVKGLIYVLLFVVFSVDVLWVIPAKADTSPAIHAPYAVAINATTGEVLFNKDMHHHAYPASITKLMTVLLMEEKMKNNETITASSKAVHQDASNWFYRMHLGETMSKQDALNALMIVSSNDVAMAVAEHIGGSEAGFAKLMNAKAKELGLKDTHFVTPNGLHDPHHYTSPYDMSIIAKADMKYPDIFKAMQATTYVLHTDQQTAEIYRRDKIDDNPLAFGGKTGYTDQAGQTIVEYEQKGNNQIIVVLMKTNQLTEYKDIKTISNYAFQQMKVTQIGQAGQLYKNIIVNGKTLPVTFAKDVQVEDANGDVVGHTVTWVPIKTLNKGVKKGTIVGTMTVTLNQKKIQQVALLASKTIPPQSLSKKIKAHTNSAVFTRLSVLGLLILGFFMLRPLNTIQEKRGSVYDQQSD